MSLTGEGRGAFYLPAFSQSFSVAGHPYLQICLPNPTVRLEDGDTSSISLVLRYSDLNSY